MLALVMEIAMPRFNPNDYIDVQERINRFWKEYPEGAIVTTLISGPSDFEAVCIHAAAYKHKDDGRPSATGIAAEKPGSNANATSWHENCETSAIGRALANMGYATSLKERPSKQEMGKVTNLQSQRSAEIDPVTAPPDVKKANARLHAVAAKHGITHDDLHNWAVATNIESVTRANVKQLTTIADSIEQRPDDAKAYFLRLATQAAVDGSTPTSEALPGVSGGAPRDAERWTA